jgi:hypothetical protein
MPEKPMMSINVKRATYERCRRLCLKIETYDMFLNKLLDMFEKQKEV